MSLHNEEDINIRRGNSYYIYKYVSYYIKEKCSLLDL